MTGTPVDVGRLLRDLHAARAEVERLRAELDVLARRIADRIDAPLIAAALRDLWQTQDWSDALIGEAARILLVGIGVRAARGGQR